MPRRILLYVILFALLAGALAPLSLPVYGTDESTVFVDPKNSLFSTSEKTVGDTIQINCTLANVTGLAGFAFTLSWDPTLLNCTGIQEILFHTVTPTEFWNNIWNLAFTYDNTAGTADYAQTWKDSYQAVADEYAPANITTNEYPEGKLTAAIITLAIVSEPFPGGFKECNLDLSNVKMGDINGQLIVPLPTVNNGYYKLTGDLPVQVYVDPSTITALRGEIFDVSINVSSPVPLDLCGWQLVLQWDPNMLNYTSYTSIWYTMSVMVNSAEGKLLVGEVGTFFSGPSPKAFTITFQSLAYGTSSINVTSFYLIAVSDSGNGWTPGTDPYNGIREFTEYARWPDVDQNGAINIIDAIAVVDSFGYSITDPRYNSACDFNNDSVVDFLDVGILGCDFNKDINSPTWPNSTYPNGLTNTLYFFNETIHNGSVYTVIPGDINLDRVVDIYDAIILAGAYNSKSGDFNWNLNADINGDGIVDIYDAIILAGNYNQHYP